MAMPRVYFAMARDGLFFPAAAVLHSRYRTPARAIVIQAGLASLLSVLGTFDEILAYFIVPTVFFVGLTVAAVFVLRRSAQNTQGPLVCAMASAPSPALPGADRGSARAFGHEPAETCRDRPGRRGAGTAGVPLCFHAARAAAGFRKCLQPRRIIACLGRSGDDLIACPFLETPCFSIAIKKETCSDALDSHAFSG